MMPRGVRPRAVAGMVAALVLLALLPGGELLAQGGDGVSPEADFALARDVIGAGGPHAAGGDFSLDATGGQPAAGPVSGTGFTLQAGFWSACDAAAPVAPDVSAAVAGSDVVLSWTGIRADAQYQVWVSTNPYLDPDHAGGVTPAITTGLSYTDPGAAVSLTPHYYVARGVNACGVASGNSVRKGAFGFGLVKGTP